MEIVLIAIGLAMDAFAVSVTSGLTIQHLRIRHAVRIAFFFGMFQAVMPVLGWTAGRGIRSAITEIDHWIAFALLSIIGGKMIYESLKMESIEKKIDPLKTSILLVLALATSIDALVVGITFAILDVSIIMPVIVIGSITFILSLTGVLVGDRLGHFFEKKIETAGGLVLIGIGAKILIEHLT